MNFVSYALFSGFFGGTCIPEFLSCDKMYRWESSKIVGTPSLTAVIYCLSRSEKCGTKNVLHTFHHGSVTAAGDGVPNISLLSHRICKNLIAHPGWGYGVQTPGHPTAIYAPGWSWVAQLQKKTVGIVDTGIFTDGWPFCHSTNNVRAIKHQVPSRGKFTSVAAEGKDDVH